MSLAMLDALSWKGDRYADADNGTLRLTRDRTAERLSALKANPFTAEVEPTYDEVFLREHLTRCDEEIMKRAMEGARRQVLEASNDPTETA